MSGNPGTLALDRYSADARGWVVAAQQLADELHHAEVEPLHLLVRALERDATISGAIERAGGDAKAALSQARRALGALNKSKEAAFLSLALLNLLRRAEREAERGSEGATWLVQIAHLINALTQEIKGPVADVFGELGLGPGALKDHLGASAARRSPAGASPDATPDLPLAWAIDLVERARGGDADPVVGRADEIRRLLTILERRDKSNPLLVGEQGVGKRALVRAVAARIAAGDVPTSLLSIRLLELDVGALSMGTRSRAEVEGRFKQLLDSMRTPGIVSVLVLPSINRVLGSGINSVALGDVLTHALGRGAIRVLGTTELDGWAKLQSKEPSLARFFSPLEVEEPSITQATEIVRGMAGRYERHHHVQISESAIVAAVSLGKRYIPERYLPDAALDLLDESAALLRVESSGVTAEFDLARTALASLQVQHESLLGVEDAQSAAKRSELAQQIAELAPRVQAQQGALTQRQTAVHGLRQATLEHAQAVQALEQAKSARDFARLGELEHDVLPKLKQRIAELEQAAESAGHPAAQASLLDAVHVASTLAAWTQIPVAKMLEAEAEKLLKMEERLERRVVGQSTAVRAIAQAVRRSRVGLRDPRRPIGSFLFLGTSGVGKTELAKAVAEFLFDDEHALTRLDMSEFMERHMAQRLLGAPPGYADSEQGGFLTEAVRKRPYSVLLFDEVEKAHQDVFNLLLQVLDDGRLTDGRGRLADFTNTVVIMTSNIGSERILDAQPNLFQSEEGIEALRDVLLERLREFFRPEFLNRIGDIVVFRPLSKDDLQHVADIQLGRVRQLLEPRQLGLKVEDAAKRHLVDLSYEPAFGARPLQRCIVRYVQDPLAESLLRGGYNAGQTVVVSLEGDQLKFRAEPAAQS